MYEQFTIFQGNKKENDGVIVFTHAK